MNPKNFIEEVNRLNSIANNINVDPMIRINSLCQLCDLQRFSRHDVAKNIRRIQKISELKE